MNADMQRVAKLHSARERYESALQRYPELRRLEDELIKMYTDKVLRRTFVRQEDWQAAVDRLHQEKAAYLQRHGIAVDFSEPSWDCPLCQDTGVINGQICRCEQQRMLERRFHGARLPARLRDQTFSKFSLEWYEPEKLTPLRSSERENAFYVLSKCREFVATATEDLRSATGLFISGRSGLGKTFLCSAICHALAENGIVPLYIVFSDLIADIRATFQGDTPYSENELLEMARKVPVLVLDDLGAEQVTEFVASRLFDIINYRRNEMLPLVISSNLSLGDVTQVYSERIGSRLGEMCLPLMLYGTDIRAKQVMKTRR